MISVLVVEDELELNKSICSFLESFDIKTNSATNKFDAEDILIEEKFDLVLLDVNLPDGSGLELLRHLKKTGFETPIIIISARDSLDDRVTGLNLGADDYISKPFHLAELMARVKAVVRRDKYDGMTKVVFNEITIDIESLSVWINDKLVDLTKTHCQILDLLISNQNRLVTKQDLASRLWGEDPNMIDNFDFIYGHVRDLRKIISNAGGNDYIKTVYGAGYKFCDE